MLQAFKLIPALQLIFTHGIELFEDSFRELSEAEYEAFQRDHGAESEKIFEIVAFERTAISRTPERVKFELNVVTDSQRKLLLEGVKFVYHCTKSDDFPANASFEERLDYLRKRFPPEIITMPAANS